MPEIDNKRRSIKIRGGNREALKTGRWIRKAPIGYKNSRDEHNKPKIIPSEKAQYIRKAFSMIAAGCEQVEVRSYLAKKAINISRSNLSRLLKNTVYIGKIIVPAFEDEEAKLVPGVHEKIVAEQIFFKVQNILNDRVRRTNKPKFHTKRPELPLRGNLLCSKCGEKLTGSPARSKTGKLHFYYHCNHCGQERHRADLVNASVFELLKSIKPKGVINDLYTLILQNVLKSSEVKQSINTSELQKKHAEALMRIEKLQNLLVDEKVSSEDYLRMKTRYEAERSAIELNLKQCNTQGRSLRPKLDKCFGILSHLDELYENAEPDNKKRLVSSIFPEKIIFDGNKSRTPRINEVLRLALLTDEDSGKKKTGQKHKKMPLSRQVELAGFEPASKQAAKTLSTCLSSA
jgi:site-specific DNA recombinase